MSETQVLAPLVLDYEQVITDDVLGLIGTKFEPFQSFVREKEMIIRSLDGRRDLHVTKEFRDEKSRKLALAEIHKLNEEIEFVQYKLSRTTDEAEIRAFNDRVTLIEADILEKRRRLEKKASAHKLSNELEEMQLNSLRIAGLTQAIVHLLENDFANGRWEAGKTIAFLGKTYAS